MAFQEDKADNKDEKFKKGDYSVHLYIEETKGLLPLDKDISDPTIRIKCFGKSKCSRKLSNITPGATSLWNEHIYFSKLGCSVSQIEDEKIIIEVLDSGRLRDSLIGSYEMDMTYIYFHPKHCILHQWVVLTNPYSEDISVMRGVLKLGASVLHESDKAEDLTQKSQGDTISVPPQVKLRTIQLVIQLLKAENLPIMDTVGTIDAYCVASFGNAEQHSSIITADKTNLSVYWLEELLLPVIQPCIAHKVTVVVYDHDLDSADDLVGSLSFPWNNITNEENSLFKWTNIYGGPANVTNDAAKQMNLNDAEAAHWRGRMLMRMFIRDDENPVMKKNGIDTRETRILVHQTFEREDSYQVLAQVFEGVNLPGESDDYSVAVQFANVTIQSGVVESSNHCCKWFETLRRAATGIPEKATLPDVFVYLMSGDDPICFARIKTKYCMDPDAKERWVKFTPNKAIGKVENEWEGGYVLLRVFVDLATKPGLKLDSWKTKLEAPSDLSTKVLVCNLYQCKNLPSADADGLADPYVKIICSSAKASTDPKEKPGILNPMWYKHFTLNVNYSSPETAPPVIVQVWDYDTGFKSDDLMGYCEINMQKMRINPEEFPRPTWYKLSLGTKDTIAGEILMSFALFDQRIPEFILPPSIDINVSVYALGLRDLKPALGWLPVNKAFLKIDLRDICYPGETQLLSELKTQPGASGSSPNIGAVISFKCRIPKDPLFCPSLNCKVYDFLLSGMSQPLLGAFTINLLEAYSKRLGEENVKIFFDKTVTNLEIEGPSEVEGINESSQLLKSPRNQSVIPEKKSPRGSEVSNTERKNKIDISGELSISEAQMEGNVVVMPQFKAAESQKKPLEVKLTSSFYLPLGYNREPNDDMKHYRYIIDTALELSPLNGSPPFQIYEIKKGQSRGLSKGLSLFSKHSDSTQDLSSITTSGLFKGLVRVTFSEPNQKVKSSEDNDGFEKISKLLVTKSDCLVRVYIIDALDLIQKDSDSASDPYLRIKLGGRMINERANYVPDNPCPKFYKCFEMTCSFPGESMLKIQVWDYDTFLPDDKIGTTKIDLEDRYYSQSWKNLPEKPIETRKLLIKSCSQSQGILRLWVEIHPLYSQVKLWDISPRPAQKFELRLIIWSCEGVPISDSEGVSDLYVVASYNSKETQETDTHYRSQEGKAAWNWRMKFKLELTEESRCLLNLQIWDRDLLSANDAIGDACLDLTAEALHALESGETVKKLGTGKGNERLMRRENEKFTVEFSQMNSDGTSKSAGRLLMSAEILTEAKALACENGEGRSEPNIEPNLPEPEGRVKFTMNPFALIGQMIGNDLKRKIMCYIICGLCLFLFVMILPMLFSNTIAIVLFG